MTQSIAQESVSLASRITEAVDQDRVQLPPLPEVALRLQEMLSGDGGDAAEVAEVVANEPAIVAAMLRIANSAMFGGLHTVKDLRQVIARIGLKQVSSIVTALSVKGQFDGHHREMLRVLWDHAVTTALASRFLAVKVGVDPVDAFLAGLLHDSGKLLVLKAVDHLKQEGLVEEPTEIVVRELMETMHADLGERALKSWDLPEPVSRIAREHEAEDYEADDLILLCVKAGNLISRKLGFHLDPDPDLPLLQEPAIEELGLEDIGLAALMIDLEDEVVEVHQLF